MTRFAKKWRVFFIEEPVLSAAKQFNEIERQPASNVFRVVPHLVSSDNAEKNLRDLLDALIESMKISRPIVWYYSPLALTFSRHIDRLTTVYDCMDELSAFAFAPAGLKELESELFKKADVVFTGGYSLFNAKKTKHSNIHAFPSSIDSQHFMKARGKQKSPTDQRTIGKPRFGYYGVIDERFDAALIRKCAALKPDWHFIMVGPVIKIDPDTLPVAKNIHYLGMKSYNELPAYVSGWDICIIPFLLNESTRFISPTKTPEYLAAGKPVISTAVEDVVRSYGELGFANVIRTPEEFIAVAQNELKRKEKSKWLARVDFYLSQNSWDKTWSAMNELIEGTEVDKKDPDVEPEKGFVYV